MSVSHPPGKGLNQLSLEATGQGFSGQDQDLVVADLSDAGAADARRTGAKAAALARARAAGLPVLPGIVIATDAVAALKRDPGAIDLRRIYERARLLGPVLIVRSSSTAEDSADTAMAGAFDSVPRVSDADAFLRAVETVIRSGQRNSKSGAMAVLIQPQLDCEVGGVMFGIDPATGDARRVVTAASEGPAALVSGNASGSHFILRGRGRPIETDTSEGPVLEPALLRRLARLMDDVEALFGSPQDIEWAVSGGRLYLLQSRPVTAVGRAASARGPLFGPGPVAETFPDPLDLLEIDLWVEPLGTALAEALVITGVASRRAMERTPVVEVFGGRIAANLEVMGIAPRPLIARLDPRPAARKLLAAWRMGRLRAALPPIAAETSARIDAELSELPHLSVLSDEESLTLLRRSRRLLHSLHGYEILAGLLVPEDAVAETSAARALRILREARTGGERDAEIVASHPEVLALTPPAIFPSRLLPGVVGPIPQPGAAHPLVEAREALRLRSRWVQELGGRIAAELGRRLADAGVLSGPQGVARLSIEELQIAVRRGELPRDYGDRSGPDATPLPAAFRLSADGIPVAVTTGSAPGGTPAGGGRASGVVVPVSEAAPGAVLVVRTLDPTLAAVLPGLAGLVAETGSVLSHLAIMAREFGVPTVVGVAEATTLFPAGTRVLVDGDSGEVEALEDDR